MAPPGVGGAVRLEIQWLDRFVGAVFAEGDHVARIVERPGPRDRSTLVSAGVFIFPPEIFETTRDLPPAPSGEHELTGGIQGLIDRGIEVKALPISGYWANLTDPDALIWTNQRVQGEMLESGNGGQLVDSTARVSPEARVSPLAAIADYAQVDARAELADNVSVGSQCVIGPDCRLQSCILLEKVTVGAGATIENAVVDAGATIPPGAVIRSPVGRAAIVWKSMYA